MSKYHHTKQLSTIVRRCILCTITVWRSRPIEKEQITPVVQDNIFTWIIDKTKKLPKINHVINWLRETRVNVNQRYHTTAKFRVMRIFKLWENMLWDTIVSSTKEFHCENPLFIFVTHVRIWYTSLYYLLLSKWKFVCDDVENYVSFVTTTFALKSITMNVFSSNLNFNGYIWVIVHVHENIQWNIK